MSIFYSFKQAKMIIKNFGSMKSRNIEAFGVTNKKNETVFLKVGETCEVNDLEGKGYLANYSDVFEKVEGNPEGQGNLINDLQKQLNDLKTKVTTEATVSEGVAEDLSEIRTVYAEKFGKNVPANKRNDKERILSKLA